MEWVTFVLSDSKIFNDTYGESRGIFATAEFYVELTLLLTSLHFGFLFLDFFCRKMNNIMDRHLFIKCAFETI